MQGLLTTTPRTEIVTESFAEYQSFLGLNHSALKLSDIHTNGCPAKALNELQSKFPSETVADSDDDDAEQNSTTQALAFGSLYHSYLLEPATFNESTVILDAKIKSDIYELALREKSKAKGFSKTLSAYKQWAETVQREGKTIVDERDAQTMKQMRWNAMNVREIVALIENDEAMKERSVYFGIPSTDGQFVQCKARVDLFANGVLADVKTCRNAHPLDFAKTISKMGYDTQLAWYKMGLGANGIKVWSAAIIPQEKTFPYLTALYTLPNDWLDYAGTEVRRIFRAFERCLIRGEFPGYKSCEIAPPTYLEEAIANS